MDELIILKLGGAAITDKRVDFKLNGIVLDRIWREIAQTGLIPVVVHGAGSFGHTIAKRKLLANGRTTDMDADEQDHGISLIRQMLERLHHEVLDAALDVGLKPFSLPISTSMLTAGADTVKSFLVNPVIHALEQGFIPILYGDMVFDVDTGFRVVSGDRIIKQLVETIPKLVDVSSIRVIFGSKLDGIYEHDPTIDPQAEFLPNITPAWVEHQILQVGGSAGIDVTGGMHGKLKEIQKMIELEQEVTLVNLLVPGRLKDLLNGKSVTSTIVYPRDP